MRSTWNHHSFLIASKLNAKSIFVRVPYIRARINKNKDKDREKKSTSSTKKRVAVAAVEVF